MQKNFFRAVHFDFSAPIPNENLQKKPVGREKTWREPSSASAAHANSGFYRRRAALIALLVLLTVAAGCAAGGLLLGASFSKEAQPAAARSPFAGWSFEEKLSLLNTLKEQGADASAIPDLSRRTEQEADEALTAALERLCPAPAVSPRALGAFSDSWGLEEKARYSQMLLANGLGNQAAEINLLPEKTDMSAQGAGKTGQSSCSSSCTRS